jgi:hypothetical protein
MGPAQVQHTLALVCFVVLWATDTMLAAMAAAMAATMAAMQQQQQQQGWGQVQVASLSHMGRRLLQLLVGWSSCCGQTPGTLWP